jgi:hypothetical protein
VTFISGALPFPDGDSQIQNLAPDYDRYIVALPIRNILNGTAGRFPRRKKGSRSCLSMYCLRRFA